MKTSLFLGMAVVVVMTIPPVAYAGDGGPGWTAKILEMGLLSQGGWAKIEVVKAGLDTFHYLTNGRLIWGLPDDFGWVGRGTIALSGLDPGTPNSFWVEGKIAQDGEFAASPVWSDTTLRQLIWGNKEQRTQRWDILVPPNGRLVFHIPASDTATYRSLVLFGHSDSTKLILTVSDSAYAHFGLGRICWQDSIIVYGKGPWELPINLAQLDPLPGTSELNRIYLTIKNGGWSDLTVWTARGGLPAEFQPANGWWRPAVDPDSTGVLFAVGYELKKNTAVKFRPIARPDGFVLSQNYPNPFNPSTSFSYSLPVSNNVTIDIYNELGTKVRSLVNRFATAGTYTATWDGQDDSGRNLPSGIYFYKMQASHFSSVKKMLLVR